jgi:hypothetical protein
MKTGRWLAPMSINKTRGLLYAIARLLGDINAISSGSPAKIGKRAARRAAGRATGKALRKIFK